jgi:hypothetical protein
MRSAMKRIYLACVMSLCALGLFAAGDEAGEVSYIVPEAALTRAGRPLKPDFGTSVENYDTVSTGERGTVEIRLLPATGMEGTLRVLPGSFLYIETAALENGRSGAVELLSGSLAVALKRISAEARFAVRGQGAVMSVRGTRFGVATSAQGDLLITCEEGRVSCEDGGGNILFAEPGRAVERTAEGLFRDIPVSLADLTGFRENWNAEKLQALKPIAGRVIEDYARRYANLKTQFDAAYLNLLSQKSVLDAWYREDSRGETGSGPKTLREKTALTSPLFTIKRITFLLEPVFYRLLELEDLYRAGYGGGDAEAGRFFSRLSNQSALLKEQMSTVRYILKLYAKRNGGSALYNENF